MARPRPIQFRAIHDKDRWRESDHESVKHAIEGTSTTDIRSAKALFEYRNTAIDYSQTGTPRYVIVWDPRTTDDGRIVRPDASGSNGIREVSIPRSDVDEFEESRSAPSDAQLERYFQRALNTLLVPLTDTAEALELEYAARLARSISSTVEQRRLRLATTDPVPPRVEIRAWAFVRNTDVVAEVLERADGVCEGCRSPAPFVKQSDGTPYLEVHHRVFLSAGGPDTVENALALCPNCHRQRHYGRSTT